MDEGLSEIASAAQLHPLALLQFFPSLLEDPVAAMESLPAKHRRHITHSASPEAHDKAATDDVTALDDLSVLDTGVPRHEGKQTTKGQPDESVDPRQGQDAVSTGAEANEPPLTLILPYLVTYHSRLLARASNIEAAKGSANVEEAESTAEEETRVRQIIDLALLQAWLQLQEYGALLTLLRQPHAVPLEAGAAALRRAGVYKEEVCCSL
jgi:Na+-transporting methylmalonyl-CoA/oxaloacetate decarboxylase gamma subunit